MQTPTTNEVLASAKRAILFLTPPRDTEVERAAAQSAAERALLDAVVQFIRAGRDDLAHRAAELAADAR